VQVPSRMLTPNVHVAVCRFLDQELTNGPVAESSEMFLERYMQQPKQRAKVRTTHDQEITFLKHREMTGRGLVKCAALHGCKNVHQLNPAMRSLDRVGDGFDPMASAGDDPAFLGKGSAISARTRKLPINYPISVVRDVLNRAIGQLASKEVPGWVGDGAVENVLDTHECVIHTKCRSTFFTASSHAATRSKRAYASSFVEISRPGHSRARVVGYIHWYALVSKRVVTGCGLVPSEPVTARFAAVEVLDACQAKRIVGTQCFQAHPPAPGNGGVLLPVFLDDLLAPLIVIKKNPKGEWMYFLPFNKNSQML